MTVRDDLDRQRDIARAIAARHGGSNLRLFGSIARGEGRPDSDVDLLIDLAEDREFDDYLAIVDELVALLGRRVDLVVERSLNPHFRPFIEADARPV
jgi:predicted nucleotidyltransferase